MRILIVGNDPGIMRLANFSLVDAGFEVALASDPEDALRQCVRLAPCVVAVDLQMAPLVRGHGVCLRLREVCGDVPILGLTALGADGDVDDGLEVGADDYLIKPFSGAELVARTRAVLRRVARRQQNGHLLIVRDLVIDQQRLQVTLGGRDVSLTPTEYRLLNALARNAGRVMTSRQLLKEAQGYEAEEQEAQEIVKVHINHLRQKIERNHRTPGYIVNIRGFGYMLERRIPQEVDALTVS